VILDKKYSSCLCDLKTLTHPFTIIISLGIQTSANHFKDAILLSQPVLSSAALQVKTFAI
jgi:hypothetical protein